MWYDQTWTLDTESDGERLRLSNHPWVDPFAGELTQDTKEFIDECGKWSRVNVSEADLYKSWIGKPILNAELLSNEFGTVAGMAISNEKNSLYFVVRGDETHVLSNIPLGFSRVKCATGLGGG